MTEREMEIENIMRIAYGILKEHRLTLADKNGKLVVVDGDTGRTYGLVCEEETNE